MRGSDWIASMKLRASCDTPDLLRCNPSSETWERPIESFEIYVHFAKLHKS